MTEPAELKSRKAKATGKLQRLRNYVAPAIVTANALVIPAKDAGAVDETVASTVPVGPEGLAALGLGVAATGAYLLRKIHRPRDSETENKTEGDSERDE